MEREQDLDAVRRQARVFGIYALLKHTKRRCFRTCNGGDASFFSSEGLLRKSRQSTFAVTVTDARREKGGGLLACFRTAAKEKMP